jgi:hypothetical protein
MEGLPHKPFNRTSDEKKIQQKTEIAPEVTETLSRLHPSSVEIIGEDKFNRLQELGASLAVGKNLSSEDRREYQDLQKEFITATKGFDERVYGRSNETKNLISEVREGEKTSFVEHPAVVAM